MIRDGNWVVPTRFVPPRHGTLSMRVLTARGTLIFRCATDGNPLPSLHTSTISLLSIHSTATKSHGCCLCNRLKLQSSDTLLCLTISNSLLLDTPTVLKVCETVFFVLPEPREGFNANLVNVFFFFLNGES
ncbi:hypothetical protein F2Q68_00026051 [Brassica cretica]|uniref:Uncharacterized protein n=1 Tax=Brassica cretica TaxID=69181 RepID=A0A8S9IES2_BRACR|nr:hypothetical protein F2Q68_00026051 [Brassica cretica]